MLMAYSDLEDVQNSDDETFKDFKPEKGGDFSRLAGYRTFDGLVESDTPDSLANGHVYNSKRSFANK